MPATTLQAVAPLISDVPDQVVAQGAGTGTLYLVVGDTETTFTSLALTATASDPTLLPTLTLGGTNAQRTIAVTAADGLTGTATVTLTVTDGEALTAGSSFNVTVTAPNTRPTLTALQGYQIVDPGQAPASVSFAVGDAETAAGLLSLSATSSNTTLVPNANIALAGSGASRTVQVTPAAGQKGSAVIKLRVTDALGAFALGEFVFSVFDAASANNGFKQPRGIYVLDSGAGATINGVPMRDGNVRDKPFVDGYVLRTEWATLEPADGVFDFTIIDNIFTKLPAGQKLSLMLASGVLPAWLNTVPGVVTYTAGSPGVTRPLPWDPVAQERYRLLLVALGDHVVDGVPLRDHPRLAALDPWIPGLKSGIRDPDEIRIRDLPGYSRTNMETGVLRHLANATDNFPSVPVLIGFWAYTDYDHSTEAWEDLRQAILAQHDGVARPRVGFWMENLAANRAAADADPWAGLPSHTFTAALYNSQDQTFIGYQVLGSWSRPFNSAHVDNNLNGSPEDGMDYGFNDYQCRYYEHYQADIDFAGCAAEFQRWHDFLNALPGPPLPLTFGSSQGGLTLTAANGATISITLSATGGAAPYTWSIAGGALPAGITLGDGGVLGGSSTQNGPHTFRARATDATGGSATQEFALTVAGPIPSVTALAALHQHGQTFLTWNEVADTGAAYRVYRSASPITGTAQLISANLIGTAGADSSFDARLSAIRGTNYFYRITAAGPDLTSTQGLFVHTPVADGAAYYAVTAVIGGVEQLALAAGQSATAAVNETVAMPEPVFQRSFTIGSRTVETYVHWVSAAATPFYPAMGNQNSVAHHLGLVRRGAAATHSLLIRPHARGGSFLSALTGTNDPGEWVLTLDDSMPNSIQNTFWHGYHEGFDITTGLPQPTSGAVHDYTTRRAKWEIEWALRTLPLDSNRVYMTGHSMGGIGSHFLSLMMPGKIAAIWTTSAKYDFSFLNDPNPSNIWNDGAGERATSGDILWGTVATALPSSEGIPVYDRLNAGDLAALFRGEDQPVMIAFHGKNDNVVGWAEKLGFYAAMNANRHGGMFFFDSGVHNRSGGEWLPQQSVNVLNRYRLDQSYPAFSNSSANGNPGNGSAASGDTFGTLNGNLDWDTASIIDTAAQWQIRLLTVALSSTAGAIAAPASVIVDVTPRRLQSFDHAPGRAARYEVRDAGNALLKQGLVVADADGLFTVPAVPVAPAGATLTLTDVSQDAPTIASDASGILLTWPATIGVRYQIEWSPDLAQWFPIGTPTLASSTVMTWTDDGSQTGTAPGTDPRRFYKLRLSE